MSPRNEALICSNFLISNWLFVILLSTLSHPPGYLVKYAVNCPERNQAGYSVRCSVRNPENYLDGHPASYRAGYLPENPASSREDCLGSNSADPSADCPDNRPERNPESNLPSNWAGNLPDNSEGNSAGSPADCPEDYLPGLRRREPASHAARRETKDMSDSTRESDRVPRSVGTEPDVTRSGRASL
jgi:hypothetical protein